MHNDTISNNSGNLWHEKFNVMPRVCKKLPTSSFIKLRNSYLGGQFKVNKVDFILVEENNKKSLETKFDGHRVNIIKVVKIKSYFFSF